jgi:hypothetical protein
LCHFASLLLLIEMLDPCVSGIAVAADGLGLKWVYILNCDKGIIEITTKFPDW